jgi:cytochrome P450
MEAGAARETGQRGPSLLWIAARSSGAARNPARFLELVARRYGDVARLAPGPYLVSRPDLVGRVLESDEDFEKGRVPKRLLGDGLLTSAGGAHDRHRATIEPLFAPPALEAFLRGLPEIVERWIGAWPRGEALDVQEEMARLNLETAMRVLFGLDPGSAPGRRLAGELEVATGPDARLSLLPLPGVARLPVASNRRFSRALSGLDDSIERLIGERRGSGRRGDDLLSGLVAATPAGHDAGLSDRQVRDEIVNLFSGRKSVAQALAWTWHLLAMHPDVQARLRDEVDAELADAPPTAGQARRLPYAGAVLAESMRLFPPIWVLARRARRELELDGRRLAEGATVLVSQYVLHRDPRYWSAPDSFHPDRWLPAPPQRPRYAYFPFGGGTRSCIGEPLAWTEGGLVLASVARRWRLEPVPDHRVRPVARVSLRAKTGIRLVARPW